MIWISIANYAYAPPKCICWKMRNPACPVHGGGAQ